MASQRAAYVVRRRELLGLSEESCDEPRKHDLASARGRARPMRWRVGSQGTTNRVGTSSERDNRRATSHGEGQLHAPASS